MNDHGNEMPRSLQIFKQLGEAYALLNTIFVSAPVGLAFLDRELRFVRINEALARMNGLPVEAHIGRTPAELLPGLPDMNRIVAEMHRVLDTGEAVIGVEVSGETMAAPGQKGTWRESWYPVRHEEEIIGLGLVVEAITERKEAEQERERLLGELALEHKRLQTVVQQMPLGVIILEAPSGRLIMGNDRLEQIWRSSLSQLIAAQEYLNCRVFHPDGRPFLRGEWPLARSIRSGEIVTREEILIEWDDGTLGLLLVSSAPIRSASGQTIAGVGIFEDISELRTAQQAALRSGERTASLQAVTAAFSRALTPEQVGRVVVEQGLAVLGARAGAVVLLDKTGSRLEILSWQGYPAELMEQWRQFPLSPPIPLTEAIQSGQPNFIESLEELAAEFPKLAVEITTQNQAFAAIPLVVEERILGGLALSFAEPQSFLEEDRAFILALAQQCAQALERARLYEAERQARTEAEAEIETRKQTEQRLETALWEKEMLLREVNHRVKNNLQAVSNLLYLQANHIADPEARRRFDDARNRIKSIALIHEKLYQSQDFTQIKCAEYVQELAAELVRAYVWRPDLIKLHVECDEISLGVDTAVPLGIIINELVSNALKHAFPAGRSGEIRLEIKTKGEGWLRLMVSDNGVGYPDGNSPENSRGLGLQLVWMLTEYLRGSVMMERQKKGTRFTVRFSPLYD